MLIKSLLILLFKGMVKSVKDITGKNHEESKGINFFCNNFIFNYI